MNAKPKHRWQFSLKTLLIVTMFSCMVAALLALLVRSRHFQEQAAFHRSQLPQANGNLRSALFRQETMQLSLKHKDPAVRAAAQHYFAMLRFHEKAAVSYEEAAKHPWVHFRFR